MVLSTKSIKRYFKGKFRSDLSAGLTVAMVVIPQSMAYAAIAGVNPLYGLYTAIIPTIISALFGSYPFLITGPTNSIALITASVLLGYVKQANYVQYVVALSIISGIFKLLIGLLKLGSISRYISNSVLIGFLTGAGVLIIGGQTGNLFGVEIIRSNGIWGILTSLIENIKMLHPQTVIVSLGSIAVMIGIRAINPKLPAALFTVLIASLFVYLTNWGSQSVMLVSSSSLPSHIGLQFHIPQISLKDFFSLASPGAAIALFGLMEAVAIAKTMSQMSDDRIDPSREMFGQGLGAIVGGFFHCMPSSSSPSRTVINVINGAKTRFSAVISGLGVLIFLVLFSKLIGYIPVPALAAVVVISSAGLIKVNLIKLTWQSQIQSRVVMLITFLSTLILPLEYAIYMGVLTTILIFLGQSSRINLTYIVGNKNGQFEELPMDRIQKQNPQIAIVNVEGDLYFAAVEGLMDQIDHILETNLKVLILRFRRTHLLASTGILALNQIIRSARRKGVKVLFCGIHDEIEEPLESAGILRTIGSPNIFKAGKQLFISTQNALEKAKELIQEEIAQQEDTVQGEETAQEEETTQDDETPQGERTTQEEEST
jgi:sulfate permease, SulP family